MKNNLCRWLGSALLGSLLASSAFAQIIQAPAAPESSGRSREILAESDRAGGRQFYVKVREFTAPTLTVPNIKLGDFGTHDAVMQIEDTTTWGIAFGYDVNENLNVNCDFGYSTPDYKMNWGDYELHGEADMFLANLNFDYNLLKKRFTPFVSGGIGWMAFDSNVPSGDPEVYCWWDYYWGYVCTGSTPTHHTNEFTWNAAVGLRWDVNDILSIKAAYQMIWAQVGDAGTEAFPQYSLDVGWRF